MPAWRAAVFEWVQSRSYWEVEHLAAPFCIDLSSSTDTPAASLSSLRASLGQHYTQEAAYGVSQAWHGCG